MYEIFTVLAGLVIAAGSKIILALLAYLIGSHIVKWIMKLVAKSPLMDKLDGEVKTFVNSFVKIGLYVVLIISIIGILGVPMASVVAVLASAGVAVGLALQGALSNLAGGIMLMIFRPFRQGDYVDAAGASGVVQELTLFYTVILTVDNKRITVPNGSLMNANVVNYSAEENRRVDLAFACAKTESPAKVSEIMVQVMEKHPKVVSDPAAPFARLVGGTNESMQFTARAWCKSADYWDVYFDLTQQITEALGENGVQAPALRITNN